MRIPQGLAHAAFLDEAERAQAARFRFAADRDRFIAGRGSLRVILGEAAGVAPEALRFSFGPHGKPALLAPFDLHFNLSHSGAWIVIVWERGRALGVDVEAKSARVDIDEVSPTVFDARELLALSEHAAGSERRDAFFRLWARKEAVLKAWGTGFSLDARGVHVGATRGQTWVTHPCHATVSVDDLVVDDDHAAAIAWTDAAVERGAGT